MILNEHNKFSLHDTISNSTEKSIIISQYIEIIGRKSLLLKSLHQIKNNTLCDLKRKIIDKFIDDHQYYLDNSFSEEHFIDYDLCISYAKKSYQRVLKEQECINLFLQNLSSE